MAEHRALEDFDRALVVTAHPDDVDFGFAGSVALLTDAGVEVTYCIVTDGQAGGYDRDVAREEMPVIRRREQRDAAAVVGVTDVRFLGRVDGEVVADHDLARDVSRVIRQVRPELVITSSPERNYQRLGIAHPDHRAVGDAVMDSVYPFARNPFAFPELLDHEDLEPWIVEELWLLGHPEVDRYLDVTDVVDRKLAAIRSHASQLSDPDALAERVEQWLAGTARQGGLDEGRLAECVKAIVIDR